MKDWDVIIDALMRHLPDSTSDRIPVLRSALLLLPKHHPKRGPLVEYLDQLAKVALLQREFPFTE